MIDSYNYAFNSHYKLGTLQYWGSKASALPETYILIEEKDINKGTKS